MRKRSRKLISILLTLSMLAVLLIPMAAPAAASTGYTAYSTPAVDDDVWTELGTVLMEVPSDALETGDTIILSLPSGFDYIDDRTNAATVAGDTYTFTGDTEGQLVVQAPGTIAGDDNAVDAGEFTAQLIDDNQVKITMVGYTPNGVKAWFKIFLTDVYVDEGFEGDIKVTAEGPSGSGFPDGDVVVGKASGGSVSISVVDDETANDDFTVKFRVKEDRAGALEADSDSIKLTLPDGFVWDEVAGAIAETTIWGQDLNLTISQVDKDEIEIQLGAVSTTATCFEFELDFEVDDETDAEYGEVKAKVAGASDLAPDEVVVGTYGDFGGTIEIVGDAPEVFAGKADEDVANIMIKESMEASFTDGRTILLTLPSNARWFKIDDSFVGLDLNNDGDYTDTNEVASSLADGTVIVTDSGLNLEYMGLTGTNDRTAKFRIASAPSTDKAELEIEDISIYTEANVSGDIKVEVSGSAGLDGEIVIAKALAPVKIEVSEKKQVQIGKSGQAVGEITITELKAGAIKEGLDMAIDLPEGVSFTSTPKVEVVEGDIEIGQVYRGNSIELTKDNQLVMEIEDESDTASVIKITGATLTVDRSVPEGNVAFAVVKAAVNATGGVADTIWPNARVAAVTIGAEVSTPAPGATKANASFVIGSTTYKVAGTEMTMDVAPYVKDGRTFLPVRYVAQTLGVADANILWDAASQKVTLLKDGTVVQLTIGSNVLLLNGSAITMDVAPELTSDRTMLPIRFIAQAFGATVGWDEATQTVTIN